MKTFMLTLAFLAMVLTGFVRAAENELSEQEKKDGWKLLFDGKTTEGWRGYKKADMPADWKVIDGTLAQTGKGGDLRTMDKYENFELQIDWKFETDGNSGIIYHCSE